jgi:hypothetical protein
MGCDNRYKWNSEDHMEYFENPYFRNLENQEETVKFLSTCDLPKLNQEDIKNLNWPITSNETEPVIKNLSRKKSPDPYGLIAEFHVTFKELTPMLLKLFHKV